MSISLSLYRLQQIDSQMDEKKKRLEEIRRLLANTRELREAESRAEKAEESYRKAERALRRAEAETKEQRVQIEQAEAMLYGVTIRNPKEVQDLQKKVESLKRHLASLEDAQLDAMMLLEEADSARREAKRGLELAQANALSQNHALHEESEMLEGALEKLNHQRKAILTGIDSSALSLYEELRASRHGLAVAAMHEGGCDACGATLTPSQQQQVRAASEIFRCPSCGRILYAGG